MHWWAPYASLLTFFLLLPFPQFLAILVSLSSKQNLNISPVPLPLLTLTHFIHSLDRCVPGIVLSADEQNKQSPYLHGAHSVVEEIDTDQVAI